ncbi:methyltransferase-UbiE family protein [Xylariomycetidae sp. FL2044]|nr:methyltransferase-UbiE family protein [Xylariomycetidae sp. FL2044]
MDSSKDYNSAMVDSYNVRTASGKCAYMLPRLKPHMSILDVGCGPGSITLDLAALVPEGSVTGLDASPTAVDGAKDLAKTRGGVPNAKFLVSDIFRLPFDDDTFDVVHCHQVLGHLPSSESGGEPGPVRGLREMRRVCKPGGIVCAREVDWQTLVIHPRVPGVLETMAMIGKLAGAKGTVLAGGRAREFARAAGFEPASVEASAAVVCYANAAERQWCGEHMVRRLEASSSRQRALELGLVTEEEVASMVPGWREWSRLDDGFYCLTDGQIICTK